MDNFREEVVFKLSMKVLVIFAFLGIAFGLLLDSEVILFDGVFSIISIFLSYLTLLVTRYIRKKDVKNFPFGKDAIEPLVIFLQYLFLNVVLLSMFIEAIIVILNGGNKLNLSFTILYLVIATVIQFFFIKKLVRVSEKSSSAIVRTEVLQWKISFKQSIYVLGGYILGGLLSFSGRDSILYYIDPIILVVFIIVTFNQTIQEMTTAFKELIGMSTIGDDTYVEIENIVKKIKEDYNIKEYYIRVNKVGSVIVLEIDFLVDENFEYSHVKDQDKIRNVILNLINKKHLDLWLNIGFTTEFKWIE